MNELDTPLLHDADLVAFADDLVGRAMRRQTWLFLLDDDKRPLRVAVPIEDMPVDPDPGDIADFTDRVAELVAITEAEAALLVWERPGDARLRMQEADWVSGVEASRAPVRAQLLSSDEGVRLLDPRFESLVA